MGLKASFLIGDLTDWFLTDMIVGFKNRLAFMRGGLPVGLWMIDLKILHGSSHFFLPGVKSGLLEAYGKYIDVVPFLKMGFRPHTWGMLRSKLLDTMWNVHLWSNTLTPCTMMQGTFRSKTSLDKTYCACWVSLACPVDASRNHNQSFAVQRFLLSPPYPLSE